MLLKDHPQCLKIKLKVVLGLLRFIVRYKLKHYTQIWSYIYF